MHIRIGRKRERDSQRSKVYAAETALFRGHRDEIDLVEMGEVKQYIATLLAKPKIVEAYGDWINGAWKGVYIGDGRRRSSAAANSRGVFLPRGMRQNWLICHELAHTIAIRKHGSHIAGHGWQWCATYLNLVRVAMGKSAFLELKAAFDKNKIRYAAPKKRVITPEQRAVLVERIAKARAAKMLKAG